MVQSQERGARFLKLLGGPVVLPERLRVSVVGLSHKDVVRGSAGGGVGDVPGPEAMCGIPPPLRLREALRLQDRLPAGPLDEAIERFIADCLRQDPPVAAHAPKEGMQAQKAATGSLALLSLSSLYQRAASISERPTSMLRMR